MAVLNWFCPQCNAHVRSAMCLIGVKCHACGHEGLLFKVDTRPMTRTGELLRAALQRRFQAERKSSDGE